MAAPSNLVHQITTGTGTGPFTVSAVNGKQGLAAAMGTGSGNEFDVFISNRNAAEWSVNRGYMSDANTLVLVSTSEGTNSTSAVNFGAGTKDITAAIPAAKIRTVGRETDPLPASSWCPTITNGCGRSYEELATNDIISDTIDFDTNTQQFATCIWTPPKGYNGGAIRFRVKCRLPSASSMQTVDFALSGAFIRNDDAVDASLSTPVVVTDTFIATGDKHTGPESADVTPAGTYAEGCDVALKLQRNVSTDNAGGLAKVEVVEIFWTRDKANDA